MKAPAELKLAVLAVYSILVIIASRPYHYAVLALVSLLFILAIGARPSRIIRTLAYALPLILIITALQALFTGPTEAALAFARMSLLYIAGAAVTVTTSQAEFTSAIENIMSPVSLITGTDIGRDIATMTSLSIAFLPMVREEYVSIKIAMQSRGVSFKGPIKSIKGTMLIIVPLIRSLSSRADRIATAMHARCYGIRR